MPLQNPERVVTKQDLKDFYDAIYPYLGGGASFEELIAHVETDATSASKAYEIGDQLILSGVLYTATAAIAIGDALTEGTNITLSDDITTQIANSGGGADALSDLSDVTLSSPTSGDALTYDGTKWANSALSDVATSGDYDDLSNKPTIPAAQVNSDWNASSGVAQILNKPTLGTAAAKDSTSSVASGSTDLVESGGVYTAIDNAVKALDVSDSAVAGSYLTAVSETDGKISVTREAADATPTASSNKMVKSGGVYSTSVTALSAATASTDGQVKYNYTKAGTDTGVSASVYGWNPLVGKWTAAVTALTSATSVSLTNPFSTASVDVFPVCQNSSGTPITVTKITATTSTIKLTFSALTEQTSFKALVKANA